MLQISETTLMDGCVRCVSQFVFSRCLVYCGSLGLSKY